MALPTAYSCASAVALAALTFAAMQVFKDKLALEGIMTILGGFIGSWFFIFILTAVGNAGKLALGHTYQTKLFPEVIACIAGSVFVSALVHRVCATTCLLFSLLALYFLNRISHSPQDSSAQAHPQPQPGLKTTPRSPRGKGKGKPSKQG